MDIRASVQNSHHLSNRKSKESQSKKPEENMMNWLVSPPNSYVQILGTSTSECDVFGDRTFEEIKVKWVNIVGP